jgi:trimeric autotransporter adhesin
MSIEDGLGTPRRQYGVLTQIYSPGSVALKWDCPGTGDAPQCNQSSTYEGGHGNSDRVTIGGGDSIGTSVTKFETIIIHRVMNGLFDTTLTTLPLNPDESWTGAEACGANSCAAFLGSRGTRPTSVAPFTTSASTTLPYQYLMSGLSAGTYTVTVGGTPVVGSPFSVVDRDNSIEFEGRAGLVTISDKLVAGHLALSSIAIAAAHSSVAKDTSTQFTANVSYSDGSTADVTNQVTWVSSAPGVATIKTSGQALARAVGRTNITAALSGLMSNSFQLAVVPGVSAVSGSTQIASVNTSLANLLDAAASDRDAKGIRARAVTDLSVATRATASSSSALAFGIEGCGADTCSASVTSMAQMNGVSFRTGISSELPYQYAISGLSPGVYTVTIAGRPIWGGALTVQANDNTIEFDGTAGVVNIAQSLLVKVALLSLVIRARSAELPIGSTKQFTAMGTYSDNSLADLTGDVNWVSSPPGVVAISTSGVATPLAVGQTSITANLGGVVSNSFRLAVVAPRPCEAGGSLMVEDGVPLKERSPCGKY